MNKPPIYTVIRMSIKNSMLSEKRFIQASTYYIIPLIWSSRTGQIESMMEKKNKIVFPSIWGREGLPGKRHDRTLQGDANVFYILIGAWDSQIHAFVKTQWMHSQDCISLYINIFEKKNSKQILNSNIFMIFILKNWRGSVPMSANYFEIH